MVDIKPFKGILFNSERLSVMDCVAPPFDIIEDGSGMDIRLRKNPDNIIYINRPRNSGNRYESARQSYLRLINEQKLVRDEKPFFYIYRQEWNGVSRTGLVCKVRLDPEYRQIRRHERTNSHVVEDRLALTKSTGLNIGLIFTFCRDEKGVLEKELKLHEGSEPLFDFEFPEGIRNTFWRAENEGFTEAMKEQPIYIADGHHRYQTMCGYMEFLKGSTFTGDPEYAMIYISPMNGTVTYPTHKLISGLSGEKREGLLSSIGEDFEITKSEGLFIPEKPREFGMHINGSSYILRPKEGIISSPDMLDVSIIDEFAIRKHLGIEPTLAKGKEISYIPGTLPEGDILKELSGDVILFTVYPVSLDEVIWHADRDLVLPSKSTYFYPKLLTGMVMNSPSP